MRPHSLLRTILQPLAVALVLGFVVRAAVHLYAIPSASMAPTLEAGDQIVVTPYFRGAPQRGHVVVFESPAVPGEIMVKRVIAVPGDLIDSRAGRVRISGYTLPEPYLLRQAASGAVAAQIVPADSYFVMGDNREDSSDSRSWGVVPRPRIVGRARVMLWRTATPSASIAGDAARAAAGSGSPTRRVRTSGTLFKWIE
ncbi:MAG: signal peptidase I [Acidobacteriota bacterium]|nr:signal peptidase I [Acidobacteriota bacterium]